MLFYKANKGNGQINSQSSKKKLKSIRVLIKSRHSEIFNGTSTESMSTYLLLKFNHIHQLLSTR